VDEHNELNLSAFTTVMTSAFPTITDPGKLEALFTSFDTDKSGTIDFKEFTIGVSKLTKGSVHDKLELLFEVRLTQDARCCPTNTLITEPWPVL